MPDLNPGDAAQDIVSDLIISGLNALAELLWNVVVHDLLGTTFALLDWLGTPDLSSDGALLSGILPITVGLGVAVITIMLPVQIAKGVLHGGRGLLTPLLGAVQYALVSAIGLSVLALLIAVSGTLSNGILQAGLHVDSWQALSTSNGAVQDLVAGIDPVVVILLTVVLYFPLACLLGVEIGLRYVGLLVLASTMPIWAAGALADATRTWLWRGVRWSLALVLMEPAIALVLVIAFRASAGAAGAFGAHAGAAASVVGFVMTALLLLVALACPLALFKLLAFVDPNTVSGVQVRNVLGGSGRRRGHSTGAHEGGGGRAGAAHGTGGGGDPVEAASSGHAARSAGVFASLGARAGDLARNTQSGLWATAGAAAAIGSRDLDATGAGHPGFASAAPRRPRDAQPATSAPSGSGSPDRQGAAPSAPPGGSGGPSRGGPGGADPVGSPSAVGGPSSPPPLEGHAAAEVSSAEAASGEVLSSSWDGGMSSGSGSAPSPAPSPVASTSSPGARPGSSRSAGSAGSGGWPTRVSSPWSTPSSPSSSPTSSSPLTGSGPGGGPFGLPGPRPGPSSGLGAGPDAGAGMGAGTAAGGAAAGGAAEALVGVEALGLVVLL